MVQLQLDTVDVFARRMTEYIVKIADSNKHLLSKDDQAFLETTLSFYRNWDGDMNEESVAASVRHRKKLQAEW